MARKAVLVYQAGIANVFEVKSFNMADYGRDAKRLLQHGCSPCEWFAKGLAAAGWQVASAHCNEVGDIAHDHWIDNNDDYFETDHIRKVPSHPRYQKVKAALKKS